MLDAFRQWAADPLVGEMRRRTHSPNNVRITLHQGGAPGLGVTGSMSHAELVRIFGDKQRYPRRCHRKSFLKICPRSAVLSALGFRSEEALRFGGT